MFKILILLLQFHWLCSQNYLNVEIIDESSNIKSNFKFDLSEKKFENEYFQMFYQEDSNIVLTCIPKKKFIFSKLHINFKDYFQEKFDFWNVNGYQSWTNSFWALGTEKFKPVRFPFKKLSNSYGDDMFWKELAINKTNLHSYTFSYYKKNSDFFLMYSNNDTIGNTIYELNKNDLIIHKEIKGLILNNIEDLIDIQKSKGNYTQISNKIPKLIKDLPPITGWTSWYNYYTKIDENLIDSISKIYKTKQLPIDFIQIDDGWQKSVGSWELNTKFSKELKNLTDSIHFRNQKAGLWLAPFICDYKSDIYRIHPQWILKDPKGNFVVAGINNMWGGLIHPSFYALDIYNPEFQIYLESVFKKVLIDWNFDLVKLDFLYAANLNPPLGKTKAIVMRDAMQLLRKWTGDKLILGCGVPLAQAAGLVDYCRVGSDIGLKWESKVLKFSHVREIISTKNSLLSSLSRHILNKKWFNNDPDVFILRNEHQKMSSKQKNLLFFVNNLVGSLIFNSDNPNKYDSSQYFKYASCLPHFEHEILDIGFYNELIELTYLPKIQVNFKFQTQTTILNFDIKKHNYILKKDCLDLKNNRYLLKGEILKIEAFDYLTLTDIPKEMSVLGFESHIIGYEGIEKIVRNGNTSFKIDKHADLNNKIANFIFYSPTSIENENLLFNNKEAKKFILKNGEKQIELYKWDE